jgi:hypothetical protein
MFSETIPLTPRARACFVTTDILVLGTKKQIPAHLPLWFIFVLYTLSTHREPSAQQWSRSKLPQTDPIEKGEEGTLVQYQTTQSEPQLRSRLILIYRPAMAFF